MQVFSWRNPISVPFLCLCAIALSVAVSARQDGEAQRPQQATTPEPLRFRYMGPAAAGRVATVAGVVGDANTYYLGSASGGVAQSTHGGLSFPPLFVPHPPPALL